MVGMTINAIATTIMVVETIMKIIVMRIGIKK